MRLTRRFIPCIAFMQIIAMAGAGMAQDAADFYKGRTVTVLISHPPGGGFDIYGRLFARHLTKNLAGHPNVVAQNMPGAAGVVMANHMASQALSDGSVIGLGPGALVTAALFSMPGARYDARRFNWIGSLNSEVAVTVSWHTSPVKTAKDLFSTELVVGAGGATDGSTIFPIAVNKLLGTKIKVISGYNGTAAIALAMERGETSGIGAWNWSSIVAGKPSWISEKKINVIAQLSLDPHPDLPNVPTALDLGRDESERNVLRLIFAQSAVGRAIYAPPNVPEYRVSALRAAFDRMLTDPDFVAETQKMVIEINQPRTGKEVAALIDELHQFSPEIVKRASEAIKP
jgi:tripartite-type tricarboxylate transporter receptor subunit TctC